MNRIEPKIDEEKEEGEINIFEGYEDYEPRTFNFSLHPKYRNPDDLEITDKIYLFI